eukprot:gene467-6878_t
MKGVKLTAYGDNSVLKYSEDIEIPKVLKPDDVLIQIYSASINPVDYKTRNGEVKALFSYTLPVIAGYDASGVVIEVGKEVKKFKKGDEVYTVGQTGAFAEYIVAPEWGIALKPTNLTHNEAASFPMVALTTIQCFEDFKPQKDSKVLITAGAGGIGSFALQYAKNVLGCAEIATTASEKKTEICKKLGATKVINYKKEKFERVLKDYDFALDTTKEVEKCFGILKPKGMARSISGIPDGSIVGKFQNLGLTGQSVLLPTLLDVLSSKTRFWGWYNDVDYKYVTMLPSGDQLSSLTKWIEDGKIKPTIDRKFDLKDILEAYSYLEKGSATGKVVIHIKDEEKK